MRDSISIAFVQVTSAGENNRYPSIILRSNEMNGRTARVVISINVTWNWLSSEYVTTNARVSIFHASRLAGDGK